MPKDKTILPNINLLSYSINPFFKDNYIPKENEDKFKDKFWDIRNICRGILIIIFIGIMIVDYFFIDNNENIEKKKQKRDTYLIFPLILIFIVFPISSVFNFPFCYRNEKINGIKNLFNSKNKLNKDAKLNHPVIVSIIRFLSNKIFLSISIILIFALFLNDQNNDDFIDFVNLSNIVPNNKTIKKGTLLPNICNSHIYGIPLYLYIPFIIDSYYFNETTNTSSFDYPVYKKMFFDDKELEIKPIGNIVTHKDSETVKMIEYHVTNKTNNFNLTILSIKGTTKRKDIFIDLQLYVPSLFLNLLSTFSIFGNDLSSISFKLLEYSLSIPYRILSNSFFIDNYLKDLRTAYNNYYYNKNKFSETVVIVGHSLGGGLSKILGKIEKEQAICLS